MAIVGMCTPEGTISSEQLRGFFHSVKLPVIGFVRDT